MGAWQKLRLASVGFAIAACGQRASSESSSRHAVVIGADDRTEWYAVSDDSLRELAQGAAVAIVQPGTVVERSGSVELVAPTLEESANLCPGGRFAAQPAAALCSGLLVAPDLVLTAGHCASFIPCDAMSFVLGFRYIGEAELAPLTTASVYRCAEVLTMERSLPSAAERLDFAWVRLDRAVPGFEDRGIAVRDPSEPLEQDEPLTMFGFPGGIPLKVDQGARVTDARSDGLDHFIASTDSFYGSSGSPIFDAEGRLAGIHSRGAVDYVPTEAGCNLVSELAEEPSAVNEQATYAFRAVDALCELAEPPAYCGRAAPANDDSGCSVGHGRAASSLFGIAAAVLMVFARRRARVPCRTR